MKSIVRVPNYMNQFQCIAGACEETCCAGWYIAIDEATYKKYKKVKVPDMKKRLDKELVAKKGQELGAYAAKIKLKNNRCAFLAKDNFCDIYKHLGEAYLSETCKMYPRNTNQIGDAVELSLALSCPEAARLILLNKEPIHFENEEYEALPIVGANLKLNTKQPKHFEDYLMPMRQLLIEVMQEQKLTFEEKWQCLGQIMMTFHQLKQRNETKKLVQYLQTMKDKGYLKLKGHKLSKEDENLLGSQGIGKLYQILMGMRAAKKWPSTRYETCYNQMIECFDNPFNLEMYQEKASQFEHTFLKEYGYILENYFVNYLYERLVPIDQKTPLESFNEMTIYLALLKLHLMGNLEFKEQLDKEQIFMCIQSFSRVFDHNELYRVQIKKQLQGK